MACERTLNLNRTFNISESASQDLASICVAELFLKGFDSVLSEDPKLQNHSVTGGSLWNDKVE